MKIALTPFLLSVIVMSAAAQEWPARPVRIIVPFAPGGVTDNAARVITEPLSARLGHGLRADVAARPGPVLDHHRLPEAHAERLGHHARAVVGNPARRERHDDAHRLRRPFLRRCRAN